MERYGRDFNRRPMRYGGEYQQWGGMPRYDREFYRADRAGRFYDRDVSGYEQGGYGYRSGPRYDRGYMERGPGWGGNGQQRYGAQYDHSQDPWYRYAMRDTRPYPSPWADNHPGQTYGYGLGFGTGRGQFIYK